MSTEALSSLPPKERAVLVDLVETESPDASRAFVALATRHATEVGGRRVLANEALVPMTIPAPESTQADEATRLLVVSEYPTPDACRTVLSKRKESMSGPPGGAIRTNRPERPALQAACVFRLHSGVELALTHAACINTSCQPPSSVRS